MRALFLTTIALLWPAFALAFEWQMQTDDSLLSRQEVERFVSGNKMKVGEAGWTSFGADGSYLWKGRDEGRKWFARDDGTLCVDHPSGNRRCDILVDNKGARYLITYRGKRHLLEQQ